jgi:ribosome-associated heat shock protein Hsp15
MDSIRIDKWLWAVRVFKTRSMATDACRSGKVTIDAQAVKPSREVKIGDEIKITVNPHFVRSLRVIQPLSNRVGAKLVAMYAEDITPPEEHERFKKYNEMNWERRDRGVGRPTKKERRDIEKLKGPEDESR